MKLYYSPRSPFVRKVVVACHELGIANRIELVPVVVRMDTPLPQLLAHNPLGKIPTLITEEGHALFDSFVIIDHLDRRFNGQLIPSGGMERDRALLRHALAHGLMEVAVLWRNERDKPEAQQTKGWLENFQQKTRASLLRMEAEAADMNEETLAIGEIATAVVLSYLDYRFAELEWRASAPRLAAWHRWAEARPSMQATRITVSG